MYMLVSNGKPACTKANMAQSAPIAVITLDDIVIYGSTVYDIDALHVYLLPWTVYMSATACYLVHQLHLHIMAQYDQQHIQVCHVGILYIS